MKKGDTSVRGRWVLEKKRYPDKQILASFFEGITNHYNEQLGFQ